MLYYEEFFAKPQCCNCRQEIQGLGVECSECHDGTFRLCTECLALGAEIGQHKKDHRYHFFDSGTLGLFPDKKGSSSSQRWSAKEEIRLLDAIEQYGFGNWQDISKHIENKTPAEAKEEFVRRYVDGNMGKVSWAEVNNVDIKSGDLEAKRNMFPQPIDHTIPCDEGPLSPSLTQRLPPLDISPEETLQLGYMPLRDDYEKEYDNEAEKLVAQLSFAHDDDETDMGVKLALVDMYSRRLRERARRKRVIRDYQLVCKFFKKDRAKAAGQVNGEDVTEGTKDMPKRFQSYEKYLLDKLRPFSQFYNCREFENLIQNLVKEKDLRHRLQELTKYRSAGITRAEECVDYERSRVAPHFRKRTLLGALEEEDGDEGRSRKKAMIQSPALIQQLLQPNKTEASVPMMVEGNEENDAASACAAQKPTPPQFSKGDSSLRSLESNALEPVLLPRLLEKGVDDLQGILDPSEGGLFPQSEKRKAWEDQYTANIVIGGDVLTEEELTVCKKAQLSPDQFLLLRMANTLGMLTDPGIEGGEDTNNLRRPAVMKPTEWIDLVPFLGSKTKSQLGIGNV